MKALLIALFTCTAVLLPVAGSAEAAGSKTSCNADEIHWTIDGPNSVSFDWRGKTPRIQYGLTPHYSRSAAAVHPIPLPCSSPGPFWQVLLKGLKTNAIYHYAIGGCGDHTFRTPPPPGASSFRVNVEGDVGASTNYKDVIPNQKLIADHPAPFVLVVGDLAYGNPNGQAAVDRHFDDVMAWSQDSAYMPAWGNHEWDKPSLDDLRNYKGRFKLPHPQASPGAAGANGGGDDWSWFDYGNVRFISYPEPYSSATWPAWSKEAKHIMDQAQANPNITFIVTYGHRPPYTSGHHPDSMVLQREMISLAAHHNKYVLNLNGHNHNYERSHIEHGVVFVTAGIGGSELEESHTACLFRICPEPSWSAFRAMHFGVLQLSFTKSHIEGSFLCGPAGGGKNDIQCTPGTLVDHFVIDRRK